MSALVPTKYGDVRGVERDGVLTFLGIPYAAPALGERRWTRPGPPEAWSGVLEADDYGPIAPQPASPITMLPGDLTETSEDCLTLNIWTPATDEGRRPVMVWIHGGAFVTGTGGSVLYRGAKLARRGDVVVVTFNYRLGVLGFLAHPALAADDTGAAGNWGLLDQIAALEWVRDNIAGFGGDPDNVTVFGESAGGMSIGALLAAPPARGLFAKAILQSGAPVASSAAAGAEVAEELLAALDLPVTDVAASLARARTLPADLLVQAGDTVAARRGIGDGLPFQPVVDGAVLPCSPWEAIEAGSAADIPTLWGVNRDEMKLFTIADPAAATLTDAGLASRVERMLARMGDDRPSAASLIAAYTEARARRGAPTSPAELWVAMLSDEVFRRPAVRLADIQAGLKAPSFGYLFTWESPLFGGVLGSCHALELPFVWGTLTTPGIDRFAGTGADAMALSARMQDAWIAFARSGNPSTDELGRWPEWIPGRRAVMVFGAGSRVEADPMGDELEAWSAD